MESPAPGGGGGEESMPQTQLPPLFMLDENALLLILCHLEERDVAALSATCSAMRQACNSTSLWLVLYLRAFGHDFWGENYHGPHPYLFESGVEEEKPEPGSKIWPLRLTRDALHNPWKDCAPQDVLTRFAEWYPPPCWGDANQISFDLRQIMVNGTAGPCSNPIKDLYHCHWTMFKTWTQCEEYEWDCTIFIAGLNQGHIDLMFSLISKYLEGDPPSRPSPRLHSPSGACSMLSHTYKYYSEDEATVRLLKVRRPRGWIRARGYRVSKLVYMVDGEEFMKDSKFREELYTEFHGTLGEVKYSNCTFVSLMVVAENASRGLLGKVLNHLKISQNDRLDDICCNYYGPVLVAASLVSMYHEDGTGNSLAQGLADVTQALQSIADKPNEQDNKQQCRDSQEALEPLLSKNTALASFYWLLTQPDRTHEMDFFTSRPIWMGLLKDKWIPSNGWPEE
ncbi:hypothetical protein QOT17_009159 [Balamuthia mandrillaris]